MFIRKLTVGVLALAMCLAPVNSLAAFAYSAEWPVDPDYREISCAFNPDRNIYNYGHNAIDIPADEGANIYAAYDGECVSACWMGDYGYLIVLWHEEIGVYTFYAHCSGFNVWQGAQVSAGDLIGYVGNTGNSYGSHLHFGICDTLLNGWPEITYYDPLDYFDYPNLPPEHVYECNCTEDYAGTYVTYGVVTYLNIRAGHGTDTDVIGAIHPGEKFYVSKSDGQWAHVELNGVSGFCSMEYISRAVESGDLNNDGAVTMSDLVMMQSYLLGAADFSEEQQLAADLTGDLKVDIFDLVMLRKMIA